MVFTRREPNSFNKIFPCVFVSPYRRASGTTGAVGSRGADRKDSATGGIVVVFSCATLVTIMFLSRKKVHLIVGEPEEREKKETPNAHARVYFVTIPATRTCNIFYLFFSRRFSITTIFQNFNCDCRAHAHRRTV